MKERNEMCCCSTPGTTTDCFKMSVTLIQLQYLQIVSCSFPSFLLTFVTSLPLFFLHFSLSSFFLDFPLFLSLSPDCICIFSPPRDAVSLLDSFTAVSRPLVRKWMDSFSKSGRREKEREKKENS